MTDLLDTLPEWKKPDPLDALPKWEKPPASPEERRQAADKWAWDRRASEPELAGLSVRDILDSSIPFVSSIRRFNEARAYGEAKAAGTNASDEQLGVMAEYELGQKRQADKTTGQKIAGAVAFAPSVIGEAALAAPAVAPVARALGLGKAATSAAPALLTREWAKRALVEGGKAGAVQAATTPLTPSVWLAESQERANRNGGDWFDPANVAPPLIKGALQNAIMGHAAKLGEGKSLAGRLATGAAVMPAEQAGADALVSLADDAIRKAGIDKKWDTETKYGTIGQFMRGENGDAWAGLASQALLGAGFSAFHGKAPTQVEALTKAADHLAEQGKAAQEAAEALQKALITPPEAIPDPVVRKYVETQAEAQTPPEAPKQALPDEQARTDPKAVEPEIAQGPKTGELLDAKTVLDQYDGDIKATAENITGRVQKHLDGGGEVVAWYEGKEVPIARIENGMMQDAKGQRWGLMALLSPTKGTKAGIEFRDRAKPTEAPAPEVRQVQPEPARLTPRTPEAVPTPEQAALIEQIGVHRPSQLPAIEDARKRGINAFVAALDFAEQFVPKAPEPGNSQSEKKPAKGLGKVSKAEKKRLEIEERAKREANAAAEAKRILAERAEGQKNDARFSPDLEDFFAAPVDERLAPKPFDPEQYRAQQEATNAAAKPPEAKAVDAPRKAPADLKQPLVDEINTFLDDEFANLRMVPIHAIRDKMVAKYGPEAGGVAFKEAMLDLRRKDELRLISIDDRSKATPEQLAKSVYAVGETFFYAEKTDTTPARSAAPENSHSEKKSPEPPTPEVKNEVPPPEVQEARDAAGDAVRSGHTPAEVAEVIRRGHETGLSEEPQAAKAPPPDREPDGGRPAESPAPGPDESSGIVKQAEVAQEMKALAAEEAVTAASAADRALAKLRAGESPGPMESADAHALMGKLKNQDMEWRQGPGELPKGMAPKKQVEWIAKNAGGRWALAKAVTDHGWATDVRYAVKATPEMIAHAKALDHDKIDGRPPPVPEILPKYKNTTEAEIVAERRFDPDSLTAPHQVLMRDKNGREAVYDAEYVAMIRDIYPDSKIRMVEGKGETAMAGFYKGKDIVGLVMNIGGNAAESVKPTPDKAVPAEQAFEKGPHKAKDMVVVGRQVRLPDGSAWIDIEGRPDSYTLRGFPGKTYKTIAQAQKAAKEILEYAHGTEDGVPRFKTKGGDATPKSNRLDAVIADLRDRIARQVPLTRAEVTAELTALKGIPRKQFDEVVESLGYKSKAKTIDDAIKMITDRLTKAAITNARIEADSDPADFGRPLTPEESRMGEVGGGQDNAGPNQGRGLRETALANAQVDQERVKNGLPPLMAAARRENADVWDSAMAKIAADPTVSPRLVDELTKKPRATTVDENALLLHRKIAIENEYERTIRKANSFTGKPKTAEWDGLVARADELLGEIDKLDKVQRTTGTEWGRAGQFRRQLAAEDFSLGRLMNETIRAKGSFLDAKETAKVVELSDRIKELEALLKEREAPKEPAKLPTNPAEPTKQADPVPEAQKGMLAKIGEWLGGIFQVNPKPKLGKAPEKKSAAWDFADRMERDAAKELMTKFGPDKLFSGFDPSAIAPLAKYTAAKIIKGGLTFADFSQQIVAKFGDAIKPHLDDIWKRAQVHVSDSTKDATDLRVELTRNKNEAKDTIARFKRANRSLGRKALGATSELNGVLRVLKTAYDFSAPFRQGALHTLGNLDKAPAAFAAGLRAGASAKHHDRAQDIIRNRENGRKGYYEQGQLYLSDDLAYAGMEESYMSRFANKIPGVAASQRAFSGYLNRLRADVFDANVALLTRDGVPKIEELRQIGDMVNKFTGRGNLPGRADAIMGPAAEVFFSPRFLMSRLQVLSGQPYWGGGTARSRKLVAREYAKSLMGMGLMYATAKGLMGDEVEITFDPRSADFGKMKFGNHRIDPLAGFSQLMTFGTRMVWGESKNDKGQVKALRGPGAGGWDSGDVLLQFVRNKMSPLAGAGTDLGLPKYAPKGKTFTEKVAGKQTWPMKAPATAADAVIPISVNDVYDSMIEHGFPKGAALSLLAILGMGSQVYDRK